MNLLLSRFKEYLFSQSPTPSKVTVKNYLSDISNFLRWLQNKTGAEFNPATLTFEFIQAYKNENSELLSSSSMERHLSSLRKFFKFLKDEDIVKINIFEQAQVEKTAQIQDPFKLKDFKNFLFKSNSSHLTIKNYIIDIKQFLIWAKQVLEIASDEDVLNNISSRLIEEYKTRLNSDGGFSPATVNRKLSSLRRYIAWASAENLVMGKNYSVANLSKAKQINVIPASLIHDTKIKAQTPKMYSKFPPLRLMQKLGIVASLAFDLVLTNPMASAASKGKERLWHFQGQPVFKKTDQTVVVKNITTKDLLGIRNISKKLYVPFQVSQPKGLLPRLVFHARFTRPKWYVRYHSYAIAHYINFAVLVIFLAGIGFGIYDSFFARPQQQSPALAALPTAPPRILSFQGRLTDVNDNPITAVTNIRFAIYNDPSASGSALLWEEVNNVSPDTDGIFNSLLGNNTSIPSTLFSENASLYLGVTIESTPELTPRQQLATVAYAANSETLQGLPPITAGGAGTSNVVLALDSSGNLTIGGSANPSFTASGGTFKLSGQPLLLTTNTGTNSNVTVAPDGLGKIDLHKPLINTSNSGNISTVPGSVQINDEFSVLATSSGRSAFTLNQDSTGPLISASTSGTAMFTVDNSGNTTISGNTIVQGTNGLTLSGSGADIAFTGGGNTDITSTGTLRLGAFTLTGAVTGNNQSITGLNNLSAGGTVTFSGFNANNNVLYATVSTGQLAGASTNTTGLCFVSGASAPSWTTCPGGGGDGLWRLNLGTISPVNDTLDFLVGANSTASAKFSFTGLSSLNNQTRASISGQLIVMPNNGFGNVGIGDTTPIALLTVGNGDLFQVNSSGNIAQIGGAAHVISDSSGNLSLDSAGTKTILAEDIQVNGNDILDSGGTGRISLGSATTLTNTTTTLSGTSTLTASSLATFNTAATLAFSGDITITGNDITNTILNLGGGSAATIGTVSNDALSIIPNGSGALNLATTNTGLVSIGNSTGTITLTASGLTANTNSVIYSGSTGILGTATTASANLCLISGSNTPAWGSCGTGTDAFWDQQNGTLFPNNSTVDFLIAGQSTASALFSFTGVSNLSNQTKASISGQLIVMPNNGFGNVGIGTTSPRSQVEILKTAAGAVGPVLSLTNNGGSANDKAYINFYSGGSPSERGRLTFNVKSGGVGQFIFGNAPSGSITDRIIFDSAGEVGVGTTTPISQLHITRPLSYTAKGTALAVFDQIENQDILTASKSGVTKFVVDQNGNIGIGGLASSSNYINAANFTVSTGGVITAATDETINGIDISSGSISDITGYTQATGAFAFSGGGNFSVDSAGLDVTTGGAVSGITTLNASSTITFSTFNSNGGVLYTNGSGVLTQAAAGTSSQCLLGGTTPSFGSCSSGETQLWQQSLGALYPSNSTVDFLVAGQSTSSALFSFTGVSNLSNQTKASISGQLIVMPNNGFGNVGIGDTTPIALLTVGNGDLFQVNSSGAIAAVTGITTSGGYTQSGSGTNTFSGATTVSSTGTAFTLSGAATTAINISNTGVTTDISLQNGETIHNDTDGRITFSGADILIGDNDILDSGANTRISLGATTTLTNTATTLSGTTTLTASSLATFTTAATLAMTSTTTLNLGSNATLSSSATALNLEENGGVDVNIAGGSSGTGCTIANSTGNLTCTGNIIGASNGTVGYWTRTVGNLFPATTNDTLSATSAASTVATFTSNNPAGTLTRNTLIQHTGGGTVTSLLELSRSAGTVTNGINLTGTMTQDISFRNGDTLNNSASGTIAISSSTLTASSLATFNTAATLAFSGDITITGNDITNTTLNLGNGSPAAFGTPSGNAALSIIPNGSGALNLSTTNTGAVAIGNGTGTFSLNSNTLDISTGGAITGATGITSSGTITFSALNGQNAVLYGTQTTGVVAQATTASTGQCLLSGASAPSWSNCPGGVDTTDVWWNQTAGALYPNNSTVDFLIGGQSTASAKFAFTGVSNPNNQTQASISGQLIVMPNNGYSGKVGIGTTTPSALVDVLSTNSLGSLMSLYWNPSSSTTVTSDLLSLDVGLNGTLGNIFNVKDNGSSVFSVSQSQVTSNLPASFNAAGDVSVAYDINFTNPTASYIKSQAPLYITAGEQFNSSNLTLETYNKGNIVANTEAFVINGSATISGHLMPATDNISSIGSSPSGRFKDIFLGPGSVHIQCTTGDGCGQNLDYAMGINTSTGTFSIGVNGSTAVGNPILNIMQGGNVGIGTTTPDSRFHVVGGLCVETSDTGCAATSGTVFAAAFHDVNNSSYYIDPAGGTSANLSGNVAMEGTTFTASNLTTFTTAATLAFSGDLRINGNDILDSAGTTRITLGGTTTLTNTTTTLSGTTTITASSLATLTTAATLALSGDLRINGNDILDSAGTTRITLGAANTITGTLAVTSTMTEAGSPVISEANIDTCAELAAITGTTGSCGNFVLSASPTLTGTTTVATIRASGTFQAAPGDSAAAPSFTWNNGTTVDTDTGLFRCGANCLGLTTGGTEEFRINGGQVSFNNTSVPSSISVDMKYSWAGSSNAWVTRVMNSNTAAATNALLVQIASTTVDTRSWFITFLEGTANNPSSTNVIGKIRANSTGTGVALTSGNTGDFAEFFKKSIYGQNIEAGRLISIDTASNNSILQSTNVAPIGVLSDNANVIGNEPTCKKETKEECEHDINNSHAIVGLLGQLRIWVSNINGEINSGSHISSSEIEGYGKLATKAGNTVGRALQSTSALSSTQFNNSLCPISKRGLNDPSGNPIKCGRVESLLMPSWYDPDVYLTGTGNLNVVEESPDRFAATSSGSKSTRIGVYADLVVGNIKSGLQNTNKLIVGGYAQIKTANIENLRVNGENIRDYVARIVNEIVESQQTVSPIASSEAISTNLISPLAKNSDSKIAVKLNDSQGKSRLEVKNANGSVVTSFDSAGNASLSGNLNAASATIAGTLRAQKIIADQIEGLSINTATLSANYITNNYYISSPSATEDFPTLSASPSSGTVNLAFDTGEYINIATFSSQLAYVDNLNTQTAVFSQNLSSFGYTTLSDTSIVGQLAINGMLILADNSINVLGADLNLQPLKQGGISFMAGLIYIDTNGNARFGSDVTIEGTLYANVISPIQGNDLKINLATGSSILANNSSGSETFRIDELGNLIASGAGTFSRLNLSVAQPVLADGNEIVATGSAGVASIPKGTKEVTVNNAIVTENSLIYITPVGQTLQNPYLLRQRKGESFTVGVPSITAAEIRFNWLIIN